MPWPNLHLAWGETALPAAGMWVQLSLTIIMLCICFFIPANARMICNSTILWLAS